MSVSVSGLRVCMYTPAGMNAMFVEGIDSGAGTMCCCKLASWQPSHLCTEDVCEPLSQPLGVLH